VNVVPGLKTLSLNLKPMHRANSTGGRERGFDNAGITDLLLRFQVLTAASKKMARLLGCCAVQSRRNLPTFQRCSLPSGR
jgi:hypothetical protein